MRIRNGLVTGLLFGLLIGAIYLVTKGLSIGLAAAAKEALLTGVLSGLIIGLYVRSFIKRQDAEFEPVKERLISEGSVLAESAAEHSYSGESVVGRLFLTEDRLYFLSRRMDILSHSCTVYTRDIEDVCIMKLFSFLPNGIEIRIKDGTVQRFTLAKPKLWVEKLSRKG